MAKCVIVSYLTNLLDYYTFACYLVNIQGEAIMPSSKEMTMTDSSKLLQDMFEGIINSQATVAKINRESELFTVASEFMALNEQRKALEDRCQVLRQQLIREAGKGTQIVYGLSIDISEQERTILDTKALKEKYDVSEFMKPTKAVYVTVKKA